MATAKSDGINTVSRLRFRSCHLCTAACGGTGHSDRHEQNQKGEVIPQWHDSPELHLHHDAEGHRITELPLLPRFGRIGLNLMTISNETTASSQHCRRALRISDQLPSSRLVRVNDIDNTLKFVVPFDEPLI